MANQNMWAQLMLRMMMIIIIIIIIVNYEAFFQQITYIQLLDTVRDART